ncbi:hypothetical protein QJ48_28190 [Paenibacillus sp. A3]|uniref:hypothetical protein n=1 Tax=Paenibacillus sp. A3 TaxID=1337054 RepID=UPI0006D5A1EE|nr:hypothetical protein [Paenibacillus sp. A3]KPV56321.1 hypothetical protein QJ48_28190 [Paenibacillus sp. A3]
MLLPHRFKKDGEIEKKLITYLTDKESYELVSDGVARSADQPKRFTLDEAIEIYNRFVEADMAWMGVRHREPMMYHFAVRIDPRESKAYLMEYLDIFNEEKNFHLKHMLEILHWEEGIRSLQVPLRLTETGDDYFSVEYDRQGYTILAKKA